MIRSFRFAENPYLKLVFQHILIDLIDRFAFFVHVLDQNVVAGQTIQYFRPTGDRHLRIDIEPFLSKRLSFRVKLSCAYLNQPSFPAKDSMISIQDSKEIGLST